MFRNNRRELTAQRAREHLVYDPSTGIATRKIAASNRVKVGDVIDSPDRHGYLRVAIDGQRYRLHRVIWLMAYGAWPTRQIDHINGRRTDNRLSNLREASREENSRNSKVQSNNASGKKGVSFHKASGKWQARICADGKRHSLGVFESREDAAAAYDRAAVSFHGAFARTNGNQPPAI